MGKSHRERVVVQIRLVKLLVTYKTELPKIILVSMQMAEASGL